MKKAAIVLSISVIVALLTGCSASPASSPLIPVVPAAVQEQVVATPLAETGISYTLADGTISTIDPEAPLPADVVADIVATVSPMLAPAMTTEAQSYGASSYSTDLAYDDLVMELTMIKKAVGRGVIIIDSGYGAYVGLMWAPVASGRSSAVFPAVVDRTEAVQLAQQWAQANNAEFIDF